MIFLFQKPVIAFLQYYIMGILSKLKIVGTIPELSVYSITIKILNLRKGRGRIEHSTESSAERDDEGEAQILTKRFPKFRI